MRRLPLIALTASLAACAARSPLPPATPVFFRNGSVTLDPDGQRSVAHAAAMARQYGTVKVKLVGYNLPPSAPAEPVRLGEQRTEAVRAELMRDGVAGSRIESFNGGALKEARDTPVGSRRVDISFQP